MELHNTHKISGIYIFTWILFIFLVYIEFGIVASYVFTALIFTILSTCFC